MKTHLSQFIYSHMDTISEESIDKVKLEISKMKEMAFILKTMEMAEFQKRHAQQNDRRYPERRFLHQTNNFQGKNPR